LVTVTVAAPAVPGGFVTGAVAVIVELFTTTTFVAADSWRD